MSEKVSKGPHRLTQVKNRAYAEVQITAEQLLREAAERRDTLPSKPIRQNVTDAEESSELKQIKRRDFEDALRRNRSSIGTWLKYASWEERIREFARARSIYERVLEVDPRNVVIWLKYAEMEMKHTNVQHARNVWNRAITILPYVEQFWYKYAYFEEMLGNVSGARQIFERWMTWEPKEQVWGSYIKLEKRYKEWNRVRQIFERFIKIYMNSKNWIKYTKFEEEIGNIERARTIFERATGDELPVEYHDAKLFIAFAKFEIRQKEIERARVIFKFGLSSLPKELREALSKQYISFEKQYGHRDDLEHLLIDKKKEEYENLLTSNPRHYDTWFDFIRLEENHGTPEAIRTLYERAILQIPLVKEKRYWKRYLYLWIYYAVFEELDMENLENGGRIWKRCLEVIPHENFTFSKIWDYYAKYLIRQGDLTTARKNLGLAIGKYPKDKTFKNYIELELQLREFDRVRLLYQKYLLFKPENSRTWIRYAEMEKLLGDEERARAIYELAVSQPALEMPELLWKSYIDFEFECGEIENTRSLYERLLARTEHLKVWTSYAQFEASQNLARAREIFDRAYISLKDQGSNVEDRIRLLQTWLSVEKSDESNGNPESVLKRFPRKVLKRTTDISENENDEGTVEEVWTWVFPEDEVKEAPHAKFLQMAQMWKTARGSNPSEISSDSKKPKLESSEEKIGRGLVEEIES